MSRARGWMVLGMVAVLFVTGLVLLSWLRFAQGDVYPRYSSLRPDPAGTRLLHDTLADVPGLKVERNYSPYHNFSPQEPPTLLLIGLNVHSRLDRADQARLEEIMNRGGRLVLFLRSTETTLPEKESNGPAGNGEQEATGDKGEEPDPTPDPMLAGSFWLDVFQNWNLRLAPFPDPSGTEPAAREKALFTLSDGYREETHLWDGSLYFRPDHSWRILGIWKGEPVAVERSFGKGSLLVLAEADIATNEALLRERPATLIREWVGEPSLVVFDEFIHGVRQHRGVLSIIVELQLVGALTVGLALAALLIWRLGAPFMPRTLEADPEERALPSTGNLTLLLQKNLRDQDLRKLLLQEAERQKLELPNGAESLSPIKLFNMLAEQEVEHRKHPGFRRPGFNPA